MNCRAKIPVFLKNGQDLQLSTESKPTSAYLTLRRSGFTHPEARPYLGPMHQMDRRSFLRSTAGGTAAIAIVSMLPAGCSKEYPASEQDRVDLKSLTPKEYAITKAAAEAFLVGVPVTAATVAGRIDRELALVGDPVRSDFKTVLGLMEHMTPLGGRVRRFTSLNSQERLKYLRGWSRSRFNLRRGAFFGLKGFIYYFAYSDVATRPITRFQGPWPERLQIPATPVDFGPIT